MPETIPFIRIFVSSPGDVNDERQIALEVIEQLPYRPTFREKVAFRVIAWDKPGAGTPMRATLTPQDAINKGLPRPSECDIVVVLFWSRMGTPFVHTDGVEYQSGTHWELLDALEANRPETVIYHRTDEPPFKISDPDFDNKHTQYKAVQAFFESDLFYSADGKIKRGINLYKTPDDFRKAFEIDLEVLVLDILNHLETEAESVTDLVPDTDVNISTIRAVEWPPDQSPFPGLRAFTEADAPIFFGRGYETDALIKQLQASRFVAVVGASGSGKSSLVGAGLIPRLRGNAIEGSKDWQIIRFTPGDEPFINLAEALMRELPNLRLSELLKAREGVVSLIENALVEAPAWAKVLLFIDQFEELFTLSSAADAQAFAMLLDAIAKSGRVRVVVTMRADFYHRAVEFPQFAELLRAGSFPLTIPKRDALRQMIERPAERAGLTFDHALVDRMLDDTGDEPGNLALMAYALDELYKLDDDHTLTHDEYEQLDGVQGAIGTRAENQFIALGMDDSVLQQVFHALVEVDERGTATRRREHFQPDSLPDDVRTLIKSFTDARLLTTSYDPTNKTATVEVAHEAILRSWPRLTEWIEATQDDLRLLRQVHHAAAEWDEKGRPEYLLWPQERLKLVYAMQEQLNPELSETEQAFTEPEQNRLLREIAVITTDHKRRRWIGERLATIGDPRSDIGLDERGLPQIAWLPVTPGGEIEIQEQRFTVKPFYVAQYLTTYSQFQAFAEASDGFADERWWVGFPDKYVKQSLSAAVAQYDNYPRDSVSWYQAVAFTRWLDAKYRQHGLFAQFSDRNWQLRLPTEQEWQWLAQNGNEARQYPWGEWDEQPRANTSEAGIGDRSTAVGMYPHGAAVCGALDVAGNLYEWCANNHGDPEIIDATNTSYKVLRGGAFSSNPHGAAASYRNLDFLNPHSDLGNFGVRLVVAPILRL